MSGMHIHADIYVLTYIHGRRQQGVCDLSLPSVYCHVTLHPRASLFSAHVQLKTRNGDGRVNFCYNITNGCTIITYFTQRCMSCIIISVWFSNDCLRTRGVWKIKSALLRFSAVAIFSWNSTCVNTHIFIHLTFG